MKINIDVSGLGINWQPNTVYTIETGNDALIDVDGIGNLAATVGTFTTNATGPAIHSTDPADDSAANTKEYEIEIRFNRLIQLATGNVYLYNSDSTLVKTWTQANINVHDDKMYLDAFGYLQPNQNYFILMDSGLVKDIDGFIFAGITSTTALNIINGSFTAPSESLITKTTGQGIYNTTTPTAITNNPTVATNTNNTVVVSIESNGQYFNSFEDADHAIFNTVQTFVAPDVDVNSGAYDVYGYAAMMSDNNLRLVVVEAGDKDGAGDTSLGTLWTYVRDSENVAFPVDGSTASSNQEITCTLESGGIESFALSGDGNRLILTENNQLYNNFNARARVFSYGGSGSKFAGNPLQTIDLRFNKHNLMLTNQGGPASLVMSISNNGNYFVVQNNGPIEAPRLKTHIFFYDGSTYSQQQVIEDTNISYVGGSLNADGSLLAVQERHEAGANNGSFYASVYARSGTTWTLVNKILQGAAPSGQLYPEPPQIGGDYIYIDDKIYTTDGSSLTLRETVSFNGGRMCKDGTKIFKSSSDIVLTDNSDSTGPQFESGDPQGFDFNIMLVSPDGNYVAQQPSAFGGGFTLKRFVDKPATATTATSITYVGPKNYINAKLNSLKLNVDADIPTTDPYTYDGEMKIKYTFSVDVNDSTTTTLYRYQRVYKQ